MASKYAKILKSFAGNSEAWMMSEYDERIIDYWRQSHGNCMVKTMMTLDWKMKLKN